MYKIIGFDVNITSNANTLQNALEELKAHFRFYRVPLRLYKNENDSNIAYIDWNGLKQF